MRTSWTAEEIQFLRDANGKQTIKNLAKQLNRDEHSVRSKCLRDDIKYKHKRNYWTTNEIKEFKEDWNDGSISDKKLSEKYGRSITALRSEAARLELGQRIPDLCYLTVSDIVNEMGVSKYTVYNWINKGLKVSKSKVKPYKYLIDSKNLLIFLKQNPKCYKANLISKYLFNNEPEWLHNKRLEDKRKINKRQYQEYSEEDTKVIVQLFKMGKSNEYIAEKLNRTPLAIEKRLSILNLSRKKYNEYEIEIIKNNIETKTIDEIAAMLPLRKKKGIIAKCEELGIKYKSRI